MMTDPADRLRLSGWQCSVCLRAIQIPLKLARMLRSGEVAYVCGESGHRVEIERWKR